MSPLITDDWTSIHRHLPAGDVVVIVPVYNAFHETVRCYESLLRHTPEQVPIVIVDDHGQDRRFFDVITGTAAGRGLAHKVILVHHEVNQGFVGAVNSAFANTGARDVVVVNSDVVVGAGWLERLRHAALSDSVVATASPLTNHGTILSVPIGEDLPGTLTVEDAARAVATASSRTYPRLPTAVGHCTYFRRPALDVVGFFDPAFMPGYSEEVDFSQRALAAGFQHVCADDVFVYHRGGSSFGDSPQKQQRQDAHHEIVRRRYPYYEPWLGAIERDHRSPLACSLLTATCALRGLAVGVDATTLHPTQMGTQRVALQSVAALAQRPEIGSLTVLTPDHIPGYAQDQLRGNAKVRLLPASRALEANLDVVYRPNQVNFATELDTLRACARRLVVNQLDTIAYGNPSYFSDASSWLTYRSITRSTCSLADGMAFLTEHSRQQAIAEGLLEPGVPSRIVPVALDGPQSAVVATRPAAAGNSLRSSFLLCLGASYRHKNRVFALEVLAELKKRGWPGQLVLAGPTPPFGNSLADEALYRLQHPDDRDVVVLASVSEGEKAWLYQHAALVLYPTVVEGFGIVPFEAAAHGVATLSTRQGGLDEVLPDNLPILGRWDASDAADQVLSLLNDDSMSDAVCASLLERARTYTSDHLAAELVDLFQEVVARPRPGVAVGTESGGQPVRHRRQLGQVLATGAKTYLDQSGARPVVAPPGSARERLFQRMYGWAHRS